MTWETWRIHTGNKIYLWNFVWNRPWKCEASWNVTGHGMM